MTDKLSGYYPNHCIHFTGLFGPGMARKEKCNAGVAYDSVKDSSQAGPLCWPCLPGIGGKLATTTCDKRRLPTVEETAAAHQEMRRIVGSIDSGLSPCCGASFDESQVRDGVGPRFCSKCKEFVFRGCNPKETL